ncbi:MAG: rhodanese-related sulfurtransferase [Polyangiales bacterium]
MVSPSSSAAARGNAPLADTIVVAALYHFTQVTCPENLAAQLRRCAAAAGLQGTLIVASEGLNGTVAGTRAGIDQLLTWLRAKPSFAGLVHKESPAQRPPFRRLKVKCKAEIVTLGVPGIDPRRGGGRYVAPLDWNALIRVPDTLLIDTRNQYEVEVGSFAGAISPQTDNFRSFPAFVERALDPAMHRRVAMFCTGGIRCEKASAYLKARGFSEVYQLEGGILRYLEAVPACESLWQGECFVFDERVALGHALRPGSHSLCRGCRMPVSPTGRLSPEYEEGVSCARCAPHQSAARKRGLRERQRQMVAFAA